MRIWLVAIGLTLAACFPSRGAAQWYASAEFVPLGRPDSSTAIFQRNLTTTITGSATTTNGTTGSANITNGTSGTSTTTDGTTTKTDATTYSTTKTSGSTYSTTNTATQSVGLVGSTIVLGAADVTVDFMSAGRITLGTRLGEFGLEGSYLLTDVAKSAATAQSTSDLLASPFTLVGSLPNPMLDNNLFVRVDYQTQMQSAELHFTQLVYAEEGSDATTFVGVRAMSIDETFEYASTNAIQKNHLVTSVDNNLIGPQIGLLGRTPVPSGFISVKVKGAFLWNGISETVVVNEVNGHVDDSKGSLLGELGFDYWYSPTPALTLRMGYQLLGLSNVGLATENLVASTNVTSVQTGRVLYHGPCLGVILNY